jgi:hypothetical protein
MRSRAVDTVLTKCRSLLAEDGQGGGDTSFAPRSASRSAVASPMPLLAP